MDDIALGAATERLVYLQREASVQKNALADAQARLNRIHVEIAELDAWVAMWHRLAGSPQIPTIAERIVKPEDTAPKRPKNPDREFVARQALEIIRARGEPIPRKELFDLLADRGIEIRGKDPEMVLSTMLWRSPDVVRIPPFGYWPKNEEFVRGSYDPEFDDLVEAAAKEPEDGVEADDAD